jgi:hypothetical protein
MPFICASSARNAAWEAPQRCSTAAGLDSPVDDRAGIRLHPTTSADGFGGITSGYVISYCQARPVGSQRREQQLSASDLGKPKEEMTAPAGVDRLALYTTRK